MRRKITVKAKLAWLRKSNIILKKEQPRESTTKRLYSFYQKNPLSTPRNLAYGLGKRVEKSLESERNLHTPKGKITSKEYVRELDIQSIKQIKSEVDYNVYNLQFDRYYDTAKKVRDTFFYYIDPPIIGTPLNYNGNDTDPPVKYAKQVVNNIMNNLKIVWKRRQRFYKNHLIGGLIFFKQEQVSVITLDANGRRKIITDPDGWCPVPFSSPMSVFKAKLLNKIMVVLDITMRYPDAVVSIDRIEVFISNKDVMTTYDRLRK